MRARSLLSVALKCLTLKWLRVLMALCSLMVTNWLWAWLKCSILIRGEHNQPPPTTLIIIISISIEKFLSDMDFSRKIYHKLGGCFSRSFFPFSVYTRTCEWDCHKFHEQFFNKIFFSTRNQHTTEKNNNVNHIEISCIFKIPCWKIEHQQNDETGGVIGFREICGISLNIEDQFAILDNFWFVKQIHANEWRHASFHLFANRLIYFFIIVTQTHFYMQISVLLLNINDCHGYVSWTNISIDGIYFPKKNKN